MLELWQLSWVVAVGGALLSFHSEFCRGFVLQGKVRTPVAVAHLPGVSFLRVEVPKRWWTWFYLVGALHSVAVLTIAVFYQETKAVQYPLRCMHHSTTGTAIKIQPHTVAFLMLFALHTTRRFFESAFITEFGDAKMHVVSTYHYVATVLSVLFDPDAVAVHEDTTARRVMAGVGLVLYLVASYHQTRCNYLLAKQKRANNMKHVLPRGDWFDVVRSPLYSTEIMLYAGLIFVTGGTVGMLYLISAWVVANQVLLAHISSQWIEDKFRDRVAELPRWKMIPYVW
ncbi:Steroid 5 alpha-reductase 3 [Phytophthora boehmeriae]|uniref:Steroid 5 alpha-reductase 3 n=1 Tax=Phytophthora boehmeriae TaxID=109152 RepID=A0A8T1WWD0_9STRA|nr:Steroid 5 alpha-reductase 3 [Phytophthora boehmeriae]